MDPLLSWVSVVSAALGAACCTADAGRRSWPLAAGMVVMLAAMIDAMLLGGALMPAVLWGIALFALGFGLVLAYRRSQLGMLRAAHIALMGMAAVVMGGADAADAITTTPHGHARTHDIVLPAIILCLTAAFLVAALRVARDKTTRNVRIELAAGAVSLVAMAAMPFV